MILTEQEAKAKRCQESYPAARFLDAFGNIYSMASGSVQPAYSAPALCIGSACMAWRWQEYNHDPVDRHRVSGKAGYCGKAGRP